MRLTELETDILSHRIEALVSYEEGDFEELFLDLSPAEVRVVVDDFESRISDWEGLRETHGRAFDVLLAESINGNLSLASVSHDGDPDAAKVYRQFLPSARSLERKVSDFIGVSCEIPRE